MRRARGRRRKIGYINGKVAATVEKKDDWLKAIEEFARIEHETTHAAGRAHAPVRWKALDRARLATSGYGVEQFVCTSGGLKWFG